MNWRLCARLRGIRHCLNSSQLEVTRWPYRYSITSFDYKKNLEMRILDNGMLVTTESVCVYAYICI